MSDGPVLSAAIASIRWVDRLSYVAIVVAMAAMTGLVSAQVFFRYALSSSIDSADELSRLFFVWAIFLAIPHGIKSGIHVGIDLIVARLGEGLRALIFRTTSALAAILMALIFYLTILVIEGKWQEFMPTVEITAAVYYIAILISTGHSLLHLLILTWGGDRVWEDPQT